MASNQVNINQLDNKLHANPSYGPTMVSVQYTDIARPNCMWSQFCSMRQHASYLTVLIDVPYPPQMALLTHKLMSSVRVAFINNAPCILQLFLHYIVQIRNCINNHE